MTEQLAAVRIVPAAAQYSVIWLHGLGADGHDFEPIVDELDFPQKEQTRFIFPHAPALAVSANNGYVMPAWYDIAGIGMDYPEDEAGIRLSEQRIRALLAAEAEVGIDWGNMVLAGFSQGGAIALQTALRCPHALAGVLALSTYLPLHQKLSDERHAANNTTPIMMMHGDSDPVVPLAFAHLSQQKLSELGYKVEWQTYSMDHAVCPPQIEDISRWFARTF